jgi:hypothetical protein
MYINIYIYINNTNTDMKAYNGVEGMKECSGASATRMPGRAALAVIRLAAFPKQALT